MAPEIYTHTDYMPIVNCLRSHLPFSLPLLRRLQFMSFPGGRTPDSKLLSSCSPGSLKTSLPRCFIFAYLDFSRGPETEMWLFSSLERGNEVTFTSEEAELCQEQIFALFTKLKEIEEAYIKSEFGIERGRERMGVVNCGSLHECIVEIIEKRGLAVRKTVPVSVHLACYSF